MDDGVLLGVAEARRWWLRRGDPRATQERLILRLLRHSGDTVFGRAHGFPLIRSGDEFLRRVPSMTHAALHGHIEAIVAGKADVLFPGRPVCFGLTTGTEGAAKLVPVNRDLLGTTRASAVYAALLGGRRAGSMVWHRGRTLYIGPRRARAMGRWKVYSEGTAFAYHRRPALAARFVPKYEDLPEADQPQDPARLKGLAERHRITAIAGNPLEIAAFVLETGIVLPAVRIVFNCGYWAVEHSDVYARAFPRATVVDVYASNEGVFGLPETQGEFLLNHRRVFFALVPLEAEGAAVGLGEARVGPKYRLSVTTPAGLWNYVTGDVVSFVLLRPPVVRLCGRSGRVLSLAGEQVTEDEVVAAVRGAGFRPRDYAMAAADCGYALYAGDEPVNADAVDRELQRINPVYGRLRAQGTFRPLHIHSVAPERQPGKKPVRILGPADGKAGRKERTAV